MDIQHGRTAVAVPDGELHFSQFLLCVMGFRPDLQEHVYLEVSASDLMRFPVLMVGQLAFLNRLDADLREYVR